MRRAKRNLARRVNGDLRFDFGDEKLTSYAGLELLARYLRTLDFHARLRQAFRKVTLRGDYGFIAMIRLLLALLWLGGRRVRHVRFLSRDPMVRRFAGLQILPDERTLSRWLGQFNQRALKALACINRDLILDRIRRLCLRTLTIDLDGTIISAGLRVAWAQRGCNPHHRKVPSYYPILAHLAQTGQILALKNRPGNIHDGKRAVTFLHELIRELRRYLGSRLRLQFRMDAAFFLPAILAILHRSRSEFAIKVPMWKWLELKRKIQMRTRWQRVAQGVSAFVTLLPIPEWGLTLCVVCYRKRVYHLTAKNFQLDLFSPDDGTYEYSAVATNTSLDPTRLWHFMAGRGAQEKTLAELKGGLAFDSVPTQKYGGNSAWQWFSVLAHNLYRDFQLSLAQGKRRRTSKKTSLYRLESIKTARFEWLNVAGRILRLAEGLTLRLPSSPEVKKRYQQCLQML